MQPTSIARFNKPEHNELTQLVIFLAFVDFISRSGKSISLKCKWVKKKH